MQIPPHYKIRGKLPNRINDSRVLGTKPGGLQIKNSQFMTCQFKSSSNTHLSDTCSIAISQIVDKRYKPTWVPPASIRAEKPRLPAAIPPGPANPLGDYALNLGWERYVIHGTNRAAGIGRRISHGCIRLYPDDIAWLFGKVAFGTKVRIVDQPAKLGWVGGELYLEVHPSQRQADELEKDRRFTSEAIPELTWRITQAAGDAAGRLDWAATRKAVGERRGIPLRITR